MLKETTGNGLLVKSNIDTSQRSLAHPRSYLLIIGKEHIGAPFFDTRMFMSWCCADGLCA